MYRFLGVGPFAKLYECEPARPSGFAVCGQSKGSERADCGEVCTQLSLGHVIREVPNKKAHSHYVLLLCGWGMDTPTTSATVLSREALLKVRAFASSLKRTLGRRSLLYGLLQTLDERQHAVVLPNAVCASGTLVSADMRTSLPASTRGMVLYCLAVCSVLLSPVSTHPNAVRRPAQNNFAEASRFLAVHSLM
jgi:hypothetical protein